MEEPIRILHVLYGMNMAGTETLLMTFYRKMDLSIIQFDFAVCAGKECAYDKEILEMGGRLIQYPRYNGKNHIEYKKWWNNFFKEHPEYHIVHGHIGSTAAIYLSIAKKHGRYTIAHSHSTKTGRTNVRNILYSIYSYRTRYVADYFFGCSQQALEDRFGKRVSEDNTRSSVLNNAIDASRFVFDEQLRKKSRVELGLQTDEFVVGTVGRLTPQKNPPMTLSLIKGLKERGLAFKFLWVGTGELESEIKWKIKKYGIEEYVIMTGPRSDIQNMLQAMDVFIFPSLWEGLGIACVEAQASGLPTLCSDTIPIEAKVTEECKFLKLDNREEWLDSIEELSIGIASGNYIRHDKKDQIIKAGYDINANVDYLSKFYHEHW